MARIGIMGGTFDPIHNGHLLIGRQAQQEYQLDQVWFMPSGHPPHKKDHKITDAKNRSDMVKLALEGEEGFVFSDFELKRPGSTYTAQTLALLKERCPDHQFYFIIGADSLYEIEKWYQPERVMAQAVFLAAKREYHQNHLSIEEQAAYLTRKYGAQIFLLHCREVSVSSEEIRRQIREGKNLKGLMPEAVFDYIKKNHLYQNGGGI